MNDPITVMATIFVVTLTCLFAVEAVFGIKVSLKLSRMVNIVGIAMMATALFLGS